MRTGATSFFFFGLFSAGTLGAAGCDFKEKVTPDVPPIEGPAPGDTDLGQVHPDAGAPDAGRADAGTRDAANAAPDLAMPPGPYQTPFPPVMPQLLPGSGTVLASPVAVPVFFSRDPLQSGVVSFLQSYLVASTSWQVVGQYGVGRGTILTPVVLSQTLAATLSDADVRALVAARVQDKTLPRPSAGTIYALYFPFGVNITMGGGVSCTDFAGYHGTAQLPDSTPYVYAVLPRCSRMSLGSLTATSSHELAEAATDPALTAHFQLGAPYGLWLFSLHGAEVGDLCQNLSDATYNESGVGVVSRVWSNATAMMRKNPCQPAPAGPGFLSVPILSESRPVSINGVVQDVESVAVGAGKTATIAVRLLSADRPSPTWTVAAEEYPLPTAMGGMAAPVLSLSWMEAPGQPLASGMDGTTLHLQIAAAAGAPAAYTTVRFTSTGPTASGGQTQTQWLAAVRVTP